jgi:integrase
MVCYYIVTYTQVFITVEKGFKMDAKALTTFTPAINPIAAIERAELATTTKRQYVKALGRYLGPGAESMHFAAVLNALGDRDALIMHAAALPKSGKAFLKAAVKLVTSEIGSTAKAGATPENVAQIDAMLYRLDAVNDAIKIRASNGRKAHIWLTPAEVRRLLAAPGAGIVGERDRLILALLVGAGLRRDELCNLTFENVKKMGARTVLEITGKGDKPRVIPISDRLATLIELWGERFDYSGQVARALGMNRTPAESITGAAIYNTVRKWGATIGKPDLAPHDLRRTFAQIGVDAGIAIQQLSVLLGHASITTTQKYLDLDLDLETTVSDFVPLPE